MPNRILREGILTSRRVDRLSNPSELLYRRLMSKLDDYGRCEADIELLRSSCYPLRVNKVKASHIKAWLMECQQACLLVTYSDGGKCYLQYLDWKQQERSESKFPAPPKQLLADAQQMIACAHLVVFVSVFVSEGANVGAVNGARHASQQETMKDETPILVTLPLREGGEFPVRQSLVKELEPLYPAVDVSQTLNEMRGWLLGNPNRRKTRHGIRRFLTNWLHGEQEKHGGQTTASR